MSSRGRDGWNRNRVRLTPARTTALLIRREHEDSSTSASNTALPSARGTSRSMDRLASRGRRRQLPGTDQDGPHTRDSSPGTTGIDGDLEGASFNAYLSAATSASRIAPCRCDLTTTEIAVAPKPCPAWRTVGGAPFYGLADASRDHYLPPRQTNRRRGGIPVARSRPRG
jgi:hypothetical protein